MYKDIIHMYVSMYVYWIQQDFWSTTIFKSLMEILVLSICAYMPRYGSFEFKNALGES